MVVAGVRTGQHLETAARSAGIDAETLLAWIEAGKTRRAFPGGRWLADLREAVDWRGRVEEMLAIRKERGW